jgi:hypothetical protein
LALANVCNFSIFLTRVNVDARLFRQAAVEFGNGPRAVLTASQGLDDYAQVVGEVDNTICSIHDIVAVVTGFPESPGTASHRVFLLVPENERHIFSKALIHPISDHILDKLMRVHLLRSVEAVNTMYQYLAPIATASELIGRIWERSIHHYLGSRPPSTSLHLKSIGADPDSTIVISTAITSSQFTRDEQIREVLLTHARHEESCYYLRPAIRNFPTIDSSLVQFNINWTGSWFFQASVAKGHNIGVTDLARYQNQMDPNSLGELRPSAERKWNFVFVVPKGAGLYYRQEQTIVEQTQVTKDGKVEMVGDDPSDWKGRLRQYVLELDPLEVFSSWRDAIAIQKVD